MITTEQVKELREKTGISIMQCRKALEEAGGDFQKALMILQKRGADIASKKSDRNLGAGTVATYVHGNGAIGAMVTLQSETDFVSKNQEFKALAYDIAMQVSATNPKYLSLEEINKEEMNKAREMFAGEVKDKPKDLQEKILQGKIDAYFKDKILLEQTFIKNEDLNVKQLIDQAIQKFGEKIQISKFIRFSALD